MCLCAVHFDIAYNADRIIEINVSTDPSQTVDISEDVVKVRPCTLWQISWLVQGRLLMSVRGGVQSTCKP